jgi:hypothetical protein
MLPHNILLHIFFLPLFDSVCFQIAEIIHNHENENVRNIGQSETPHRKHKKLKLGGGHLYERSSVETTAVV